TLSLLSLYRRDLATHQQRPGAPLRIGTLWRTACQRQKERLPGDGGKGQGAGVGRRGHSSGGPHRCRHTPRRCPRMAGSASFAGKQTREPPRPATLQEGPGSLPRQARRAATQASFAVLEKKSHIANYFAFWGFSEVDMQDHAQ